MAGFVNSTPSPGIVEWTGDPTDQAGHEFVLAGLVAANSQFDSTIPAAIDNPRKGNLGEFVALRVRRILVPPATSFVFAANAFNPLSRISRSELDLVWIHFGAAPQLDEAYLQEVKATGDPAMPLAYQLGTDYGKLFGSNPRFTLQTRLDAIKNQMEEQGNAPLAPRVQLLSATSPQTASRIRLIPTVFHERVGATPSGILSAVRSTIMAMGWLNTQIEMWSIALDNFDNRLARLVAGQP